MNYVIYISLVLSMITATLWSNVQAECCPHGTCPYDKHAEGYHGWCCGCGSCNIFCCNCDRGCNWGFHAWNFDNYAAENCDHKKKREVGTNTFQNATLNAYKLFKSIDINGNNAINIKEAAAYLKNSTVSKRSASFSLGHELSRMDTNNDGIISPDEFDESLKL